MLLLSLGNPNNFSAEFTGDFPKTLAYIQDGGGCQNFFSHEHDEPIPSPHPNSIMTNFICPGESASTSIAGITTDSITSSPTSLSTTSASPTTSQEASTSAEPVTTLQDMISTELSSTADSTTSSQSTNEATTPSPSTLETTTTLLSTKDGTKSSPSAPHTTTEVTTVLSSTHDGTTSAPEATTEEPTILTSSKGGTKSAPSTTTDTTTVLSSTHDDIMSSPFSTSVLGATTMLTPTTEVCGMVSEVASGDTSAGNQQCGSTFTLDFPSLNINNATVLYSYIPLDEISDGTDNVRLTDVALEHKVISIVSSVVDITLIDGDTTIQLTDGSVEITFVIETNEDFPPKSDSSEVHCAYLVNESTWSTDGLSVISISSDTVVCHSTHLTSFAVLLSAKPPEGIHAIVQSYLSYILGGISIASLTMAVIIYFATGVYNMLKIQIHINLALSTALGQILFLAMASSTHNRTLCKGVTVTLHYLFTSALAWTMIEGIFLYRTTAVGFKPLKIGWLSLFAWGGSLVVVGVSFGILYETYGTSTYCWLHAGDNSIYIFAGCVFGTELFSFMVLWFVMRTFSSLKANKKKDEIDKIKATIRALGILLPILGLTWLAGTFTSITKSDDVIIFQYIFILCFSLQGVCIFVFHCLLVPDVKVALKLRFNRRVADSTWVTSRSSKSTATSTF